MILSFLGKMIKNVIESVVNLICTINQVCALPNLIGLYYITSSVPPKPRYGRHLTGRMAGLSAKIFPIMALYRLEYKINCYSI